MSLLFFKRRYKIFVLFILLSSTVLTQAEDIFSGHSGWVRSVVFSPDGNTVLSGSADDTLKLWDVNAGQLIRSFSGHTEDITSVAYSPDGSTVLSGSEDYTMKLWNVYTGEVIRTFTHSDKVWSVAYSPNGKTALSGSSDKTMNLWDLSTGTLLKTFVGHSGIVVSVAFSPDGQEALSGSWDKTLKLWDIFTGELIKTFNGHTDSVYSVAYSPDGQTILSGSFDNTIKLWDVNTGDTIKTFEGHSNRVYSVKYSPNSSFILSGSVDGTIKLWNIHTGDVIRTFSEHSGAVYTVACSFDGGKILSGGNDNTLRLRDSNIAEHSLDIHVNGNGKIIMEEDNTSCDSHCSEKYVENTVVTLTAMADTGYIFDGWDGDCSNGNVTLSSDKVCNVNFSSGISCISPETAETIVDESVTLTSNCNSPYNWSWSAGKLEPSDREIVKFSAASEGEYTVSLEGSESVITVYKPLSVSQYYATLTIGETKSFKITGGKPDYDVSISVGEGNVSSVRGDGTFDFTAKKIGDVILTIKDNLSSDLSPDESIFITIKGEDTLHISPNSTSLEFGEPIVLTAAGGIPSYIWQAPNGGNLSSNKGDFVTYTPPRIKGEYIIEIIDKMGDKAQSVITVTDGTITITPQSASVILGHTFPIEFRVSGGNPPYTWKQANGNGLLVETTETTDKITYTPPNKAEEYQLNAVDKEGNFSTAIVRVVSTPKITPSSALLSAQESQQFQVQGGIEPYNWTAEMGDLSTTTGRIVTYHAPKQTGIYTLTVSDSFGNTSTTIKDEFGNISTIEYDSESHAEIEVEGNLQCSPLKSTAVIGETVKLTAFKGSGNYTWPDGTISENWETSFDQTGRKEVIVTDSMNNSCLMIVEIVNEGLNISPSNPKVELNEVINFSVTGGVEPYEWDFDAGSLSSSKGQRVSYFSPNRDGKYTVRVTDSTGKQAIAEVIVGEVACESTSPESISLPLQCSEKECNYSIYLDQPGFYIATVRLPECKKEGMWGVEFRTSGGINTGGFNSGAILKENGDRPGFMAFNLSQAEAVNIKPIEYTGKVSQMKIQLSRRENGNNTIVFGPTTSASGQTHTTAVLQPGFYVAEAFSEADAPRGRFGFEVLAKTMSGGVNIGGWIDSYTGGNGEGFGGLSVSKSQTVEVNVFFGETYGGVDRNVGSDYIELNIYRRQEENGNRILMFSPIVE